MSAIPESSLSLLAGLDVMIIDALRPQPHPSHSNIAESLRWVERVRPRQAWFTHMSHEVDHEETEKAFPRNVRLALTGCAFRLSYSDARLSFPFRSCRSPMPRTVAAIGNFDGVHRGQPGDYRARARTSAQPGSAGDRRHLRSHPLAVLRPDQAPKLITPMPQRLQLLAETGMDATLVIPFTREFSLQTAREFAERGFVRSAACF